MVLHIDSFELLVLKVLVSDEISKLYQRIEFWRKDKVLVSDEDKTTIIDYTDNQINVVCKLYQKLLQTEV